MSISFLKKLARVCFWLGILLLFIPPILQRIHFSGIEEGVKAFYQSLQAAQEAKRIINKGSAFSVIEADEVTTIFDSYRRSIERAASVDEKLLNEKYQMLGTRFRDQFIKGLQLQINGHETNDMRVSLQGQQFLGEWDDWYIGRLSEIRNVLIRPPFFILLDWVCYALAGIFFLVWGILKLILSGNFLFWFKVKDYPDSAYDWFSNNRDWAVLDVDSFVDYARLYPKEEWAGPFSLCVPKLNGKVVKIFGKAHVLESTQKEFLRLIQSIEN